MDGITWSTKHFKRILRCSALGLQGFLYTNKIRTRHDEPGARPVSRLVEQRQQVWGEKLPAIQQVQSCGSLALLRSFLLTLSMPTS